MKEAQAIPPATPQTTHEIRNIQERLQAIRAGQSSRTAPPSRMVEMFPSRNTVAPAPTERVPLSVDRRRVAEVPAVERDRPSEPDDLAALQRAAAAEARQAAELRQAAEAMRAMSSALPSLFSSTEAPTRRAAAGQPEVLPRPEIPVTEVMRLLEVKADEINQLSAAQEAAMLELKAIAQKLERDWKAFDTQQQVLPGEAGMLPSLCEYLETEVPLIQRDESGAFVVTKRPVDLFQAERDAESMAYRLRQRGDSRTSSTRLSATSSASRAQTALPIATAQRALRGLLALVQRVLIPSDRSRSARAARRSRSAEVAVEQSPMSLQTGAAWLIGSAIARIGADLLLAANPGFWLPVAALIIAPAILAIYRTTVAPHTSVTWGYRIFLILTGLLIGGRVL